MTTKKRVLFIGEASWTFSGFSTMAREILSRLHARGDLSIAELSCYGSEADPRRQSIPWKTYPNNPRNAQEEEIYRSSPTYQWGEWRFEDVCLDYRPDVCIDVRDFWNFEFIPRSPFRRHFRLGLMPAWDSSPVQDQWIETIRDADGLLSYSHWAVSQMQYQGGNLPIKGVAPAGVDHSVFKTRPKAQCRGSLGIPEDSLVVLMVARNQARKLIPDLMEAFAELRSAAPAGIRDKLRLYLHTAWPDVGWDIPRFLRELEIGDATLFTYCCRDCTAVFAHKWMDARNYCPACGGNQAKTPTADAGVTPEAMSLIFGSADAYAGYALAAGQEIPVVEAAACGVKSFVVNYSAMEDYPQTLLAEPVKVQRMFWDGPTHTRRALPDNADCAAKLLRWLTLPEPARLAEGARIAARCRATYTWERAADAWAALVEGFAPAEPWDSPPRIHQPQPVPHASFPSEYVIEGLRRIAGRPDLIGSYLHLRMARDLERGSRMPHTGLYNFTEAAGMDMHHDFVPYTREDCERDLLNLCNLNNHWERKRAGVRS